MELKIDSFELTTSRGNFGCIFRAARRLELSRGGGYFCVADPNNGHLILLLRCGFVPEEKMTKYSGFAQEKALRLAQHPDHLTSHASRNFNARMYGGAIRTPRYIFSFSGFSEEMDEAVVLEYAYRFGFLAEKEAKGIALSSGNETWEKLREEMNCDLERPTEPK
jgi:hypothetical protein